MWVDGSYLTTKKNPRDVDVVVLADAEAYNVVEESVAEIDRKAVDGVDIHFVQVYPLGHPLRYVTDLMLDVMVEVFGTSRERLPKGVAVISLRGIE